jgi:uncharacterized protein YdaU (DUF1376 family)
MKAPAVQWYWSDFLVDTMGWSCAEIGAYMRLLGYEWVNGCIPEDTKRQSMICKIDHGNYRKNIYPNVIGKFEFHDGGGYNPRLEIERQKQQQYIERQREKGKLRAEKMWQGHIATAKKRLQPKDSSSSSSSSSNINNKKNIIGIPPKIEDVRGYCLDRNNRINAEQFFDYYESRGWMIGKNKMKNWQAAIRTWEKNNKDNPVKPTDTEDYIGKAMRGEI